MQKNKSSKPKQKVSKKKVRRILKKTFLGCMTFILCLPILSGLIPQKNTTAQIDPKLAQAYLESMKEEAPETPEPMIEGRYEVLSISDNTSLSVKYNDKEETVKLIGIKDAAQENLQGLEMLMSDNYVDLEFDGKKRDENGNLLAYVFLEDGRFLNQELLLNGHAEMDEDTENVKYKAVLQKAQKEAKERKAGIWE